MGKFLNIFLELFDTKIGSSEELKLRLKCLNVTEKNAKKQLHSSKLVVEARLVKIRVKIVESNHFALLFLDIAY